MKRHPGIIGVLVVICLAAVSEAQTRREIRFPDLPGHRTLKCDFHMHTVFSDGQVWPTVRVNEAWREGLDAIAITDHIEYRPHKQDIRADHNRPYELALARAKELNILLIRGTEITRDTPPGHFNALFLKDVNPLDTKDFYEVFRQAAAQDAFIIWNHPGWQGVERGKWGEAQTRLREAGQLHAVEICNGNSYYPEGHQSAIEKGLYVVGCSDEHRPRSDRPATSTDHRTMTLVFATEKSESALREALFAGRTIVWYQNQLLGPESLLAPMLAACVEIRPPHRQTRDAVWVEIRNQCELDLTLDLGPAGSSTRAAIPAGLTGVVRLAAQALSADGSIACKAANFLTAPDTPLQTRLMIATPKPLPATMPAGI
jgi:hypothetical protein